MNSEQSAVILKRFEAPDEIRVLEKGRFESRRLFDRLWYAEPDAITNAIGYAKFSRSHDAVIRVYDDACNVIETHDHAG